MKPDLSNLVLYELRQASLWGDYGDVLISGYCRRETADGPLLIERTGPYLPPISFPFGDDLTIVVSDEFKKRMEASCIRDLRFKPAILNKVVKLNWHEWPLNAAEPKKYPKDGEPEYYLWEQKHSQRTAKKMNPVWEVIPPIKPCVFNSPEYDEAVEQEERHSALTLIDREYSGLFSPDAVGPAIVDETTKRWFDQNAAAWIQCRRLDLAYDPDAITKLDSARRHHREVSSHLSSDEYRQLALLFCKRHGFAIPPAFQRADRSCYRYCVISLDSSPPKLSASTYGHADDLAKYLEHKVRISVSESETLSNLLAYDLETDHRLIYLGDNQFDRINQSD